MATDFGSLYEAALVAMGTAINASAFATARLQLALARTYAAGLPDYATSGRSLTRHSAFANLDKMMEAIDVAERAAQGGGDVLMVPVGFGRPG